MNIIVFGASGSVGSEIVKQATEKGYHVTAFVRSPEKFPLPENQHLRIYKGDVLNLAGVKNALQNQDAAICALGDGKAGKIRAAGTKNIVEAMEHTGIKRLICLSTIGAGDSYESLNFMWKYIMFGLLLKRVLPDHNLQEKYIRESTLDYTIVRPGALTNGPVTNAYKTGLTKDLKKLSLKISRTDVADCMLRQLSGSGYIRKAVSISN